MYCNTANAKCISNRKLFCPRPRKLSEKIACYVPVYLMGQDFNIEFSAVHCSMQSCCERAARVNRLTNEANCTLFLQCPLTRLNTHGSIGLNFSETSLLSLAVHK